MKQTAVEWLIEEFKEKLTGNNLPNWVLDIIQQAKAMEKEQIMDAFEHVDFNIDDGLHYYEQTFKSE